MKCLKKIIVGCLALITFSTVTGVAPVANEFIGATETEASVMTNVVGVSTVQKSLNNFRMAYARAHGYYPFTPLSVDGICGPATNSAIQWFQYDCYRIGLLSFSEIDTIVGPKTWNLLKVYNF